MPSAKAITRKDVLQQIKADLIGKDSHRGITLTYAWMANQFGHFSLGFIPAFLLFRWLSKTYPPYTAATWSPFIIALFWLAFETYNFLGPLLTKRPSRSKFVFIPGKEKRKFAPAWANIAFDTFTDLLFFWIGAYAAGVACHRTAPALTVLLILMATAVYPVRYWFLTKMYLQAAHYPVQFRLSQWDRDIDGYEMDAVEAFVKGRTCGQHLLLFGSKGTGKTSLAVGLATEMSIKHCACHYTTAMKLYCLFYEGKWRRTPGALWDWRGASVLVIDDVNPGEPIKDDIVSPELFLTFLNAGVTNAKCLKEKNVVWVLGSEYRPPQAANTWAAMLVRLGVDENKIRIINLQQNNKP